MSGVLGLSRVRLSVFAGVVAVLVALTAVLSQPGWAATPLSELPTLDGVAPRHGVAMHGRVKYGPGFAHFDYVNPDAPQGGALRRAARGTYDSFNPYVLKGSPAQGAGLVFETLMASTADEPFSEYGLIADAVYMPEDRSWVAFHLDPEARWHDGTPITVADVVFSLNALKSEGHPFYRFYYKNVASARKVAPRTVRFDFAGGPNRELPLIVGQMPVLAKHYWTAEGRSFGDSTLEPPLGSGPYRVADHEPGRYVVYEKVADYWGGDRAVNAGRWNFARIRYDYFRDPTVIREAVKAGSIDIFEENQAKSWATAYDVPAVAEGRLKKVEIDHDRPTGMQGFAMNTRRAPFDRVKVRRAMAYAFDFPWTNRNLFFGQYDRTESYFSNSELAARGVPEGREKAILERFRGQVPPEVFTEDYDPPSTSGDGYPRDNLKTGMRLLREAGYVYEDMKLVDPETGRQLSFEILLNSQAFERIVLPYRANLEKLGFSVSVRVVDSAQYQNRLDSRDFDMIVHGFGQSLSPGNEQRDYWASSAAERPGSRNVTGVADPVVDQLVDMIIQAPNRGELVHRTRALDRVLLWHHLVVPNWHIGYFRVVYWDKFGRPETPPYGLPIEATWWVAPDKAEVAAGAGGESGTGERAAGGPGWLTGAGLLVLLAAAALFFRRARSGASA
jgi:microcin C transport system substrate-binding protein